GDLPLYTRPFPRSSSSEPALSAWCPAFVMVGPVTAWPTGTGAYTTATGRAPTEPFQLTANVYGAVMLQAPISVPPSANPTASSSLEVDGVLVLVARAVGVAVLVA